jgi:hypothetical protein
VTTTQLDLFGGVEKAEREATQRQRARDAWRARFERADWVAPYDTAGGTPEGTAVPGWRCPDPECGEIEPNGFLLAINHGWDPDVPGREPYDGRCYAIKLRAAHKQYEAAQGGAPAPVTPVGGAADCAPVSSAGQLAHCAGRTP